MYEYANGFSRHGHDVTVVHPVATSRGRSTTGLKEKIGRARRRFKDPRPDWLALDDRVKVVSVPRLDPAHVPDADAVVATWWGVANEVAGLPASKGIQFHLVHHYEGDKYPVEEVDHALSLPLIKVAVSRHTAEDLARRGHADVFHVPNGVDTSMYRVTRPPADRDPHRVAMNYVDKPSKDPAAGIAALEKARQAIPDLSAVLFGIGGAPERLPSFASYEQRLSTDALVRDVYNDCAIFLCSSRIEGFGLPGAEAMASGCAVVTTDCGGVTDYAKHEQTALLSPPGDAGALAENIVRLASDEDLRQRIVSSGLEEVRRLDWSTASESFERIILEQLTTAGRIDVSARRRVN